MANRWEYPVRSDGKFVVDRWGIAILEVCGTDGDFHDGVVGFTKSVAASMNAAHYGDLQRQEKNIVDDDLKALDAFAERGKEMAKKLGLTVNAEATGHVIAAYINVAGQMAVANALGQFERHAAAELLWGVCSVPPEFE